MLLLAGWWKPAHAGVGRAPSVTFCLRRRALPPGLSQTHSDPRVRSAPWAPEGAEAGFVYQVEEGIRELSAPPSPRGRLNQPEPAARDNKGALCAGRQAWGSGKRPYLWLARPSSAALVLSVAPAHPRPSDFGRPAVSPASRRAPAAPCRPFRPLDFIHAPPGPHLGGDLRGPRREITDGGTGR